MKRLQVLMSDERMDELDTLVKLTGLKTRTELINYALTLFEWAVKERLAGRIIASVDEQNERYKEVELPGILLPQPLSRQALQILSKIVDDITTVGSKNLDQARTYESSLLGLLQEQETEENAAPDPESHAVEADAVHQPKPH